MQDGGDIWNRIQNIHTNEDDVLAYRINNSANNWGNIFVIYNGSSQNRTVSGLPHGSTIVVNHLYAGVTSLGTLGGSSYMLPPRSMVVLVENYNAP